MSAIFYPGCKITAAYPRQSAKLREYVESRFAAKTTGCCRKNWEGFGEGDVAIAACNNCQEVLRESSGFPKVLSVWQLIDEDPDFPLPNYDGEELTLVDCWIATGNHTVHDAVRSLLGKIGFRVVEMAQNRDDSRFCGSNLLVPSASSNLRLAPRRWGELKDAQIEPLSEDQWNAHFIEACSPIQTKRCACYCTYCADALRAGGATPVHMLELLFGQ